MNCKQCNQPLNDNATFCSNCGAPVENEAPATAQETESVFTQTAPSAPTFPASTQPPVGAADPDASPEERAAAVAAAASSYANAQQQSGYAQPQDGPVYAQPNPSGGYQADYASGRPMTPSEQQGKNIGTVPLILGIISIVLAVILGWTIIGPIAGIVLGILGITKGKKALAIEPNNSEAKGGRVTGIIGLILNILALIATIAIAVVLGMFVTTAMNNPESLVEEMEKIAQLDESGQAQQELDQLKQELEKLDSSALLDSGSGSGFGTPAAPTDYTGGEAFDTWATECTSTGDQPTLYALTELKGWQMETMLQKLGYQWYPDINSWVRESDGSYYGMVDSQGVLNDVQIAKGDKGGAGLNAYHVLTVKGFKSAREALSQMSQVTLEDAMFSEDDQSAAAVVYGPSMSEYLVIAQPSEIDGADYYALIMFPQEAIASGLFNDFAGSNAGTTIPEVWKTLTGGAVGDTISNN